MLKRIASGAFVGLLVSALWGLYFANGDKVSPIGPLVYVLARVTQPVVAVLLSYVHSPIGLTVAVAVNAATYALAGLIVGRLARK